MNHFAVRQKLALLTFALIGWSCSPEPDPMPDGTSITSGTATPDQRDRFSTESETEANVRRERIRAEIAELGDHPWAGEYYFGDGLGVNVRVVLAPISGYVFDWHGCMGCYDRNWGAVREQDGELHLEFTFPNDRDGFKGCAPVLVPVHYDATHNYLAEPSELADAAPCRDYTTLARRQ
ncbi:MAG: hypothetical protein K8S98_02085 [Planctomycetes bacterium]|nr:hypothetical protein [Planctomycetota bacterium]